MQGRKWTESVLAKIGMLDAFNEVTSHIDGDFKFRVKCVKYNLHPDFAGIAKQYLAGVGIAELTKQCGHVDFVHHALRINGVSVRSHKERIPYTPRPHKGKPAVNRKQFDEAKIIREYQEGQSALQLSKKYDTTPATILNLLERNGIKTRGFSAAQKASNLANNRIADYRAHIDAIREDYQRGALITELAEKYGMNNSRIRDIIEDLPHHAQSYVIHRAKGGSKVYGVCQGYTNSYSKDEVIELYKNGMTAIDIAKKLNVCDWTVLSIVTDAGLRKPRDRTTEPEKQCLAMLPESLEIKQHDRTILNGKELDIFIPSHNLAIEINGLYWHSTDIPKIDRSHIEKFMQCKEKGIKLLQLTDADILGRPKLIKSMLSAKLGLNERIYARKTAVTEIPIREANKLFDQWHYQGQTTNSAKVLALIYQHEVVAMLAYRMQQDKIIIDRYASKLDTTVVGGYSKLENQLPNLRKETFSLGLISDGSLYARSGYHTPGYATSPEFYITDCFRLMNRQHFMKHKLQAKFGAGFDPNKTEWENVVANGLRLYFGAGITKWIKEPE